MSRNPTSETSIRFYFSKEEKVELESQSLQLPLMDEENHVFHRLLKTKRSTFLPSRKKKGTNEDLKKYN